MTLGSVSNILLEQVDVSETITTKILIDGSLEKIEKDDQNVFELISIEVSFTDFILIYIIGIGIIVISITLASRPIMYLKPKQILV